MKEKMIIKIPREELPRPRIPIWKMKPEKTHMAEKTDPKAQRRKGKEEIRKFIKNKADY